MPGYADDVEKGKINQSERLKNHAADGIATFAYATLHP